jgi:SOS-response transcriptional repressor LexA
LKQAFYNKKEAIFVRMGCVMNHDGLFNVRFLGSVSAGFPSPADDYKEPKLDLNELVALHPLSTYYMRVAGDSIMWNTLCSTFYRFRRTSSRGMIAALS